jgi:hypothetical protein
VRPVNRPAFVERLVGIIVSIRCCRLANLFIALLVLVTPAGCAKTSSVVVKGKLIYNGQVIRLDRWKAAAGELGIQVSSYPLEPGPVEPATYDAVTGAFEVRGSDGKGIRPGRYKITVTSGAWGEGEMFQGRFNYDNSPITRDVGGSGPVEMTVDLANPTG